MGNEGSSNADDAMEKTQRSPSSPFPWRRWRSPGLLLYYLQKMSWWILIQSSCTNK